MRLELPIWRAGYLLLVFWGTEYDKPVEVRFFGPNCWIFKLPLLNVQYYSKAWRKAVDG